MFYKVILFVFCVLVFILHCRQINKKKDMDSGIGIDLYGGIGNMLFQLATAYALSKRNNSKMYIMYIHENIHGSNKLEWITNKIQKTTRNLKNHYYETGPYSCTNIHVNSTNLHGYFQCEKYFIDYRSDILTLFKEPIYLNNVLESYDYSNVIAIHVRLGDYLYPGISDVLFIDLTEYYKSAIQYIYAHVDTPKFIIVCEDTIENIIKVYPFLESFNTLQRNIGTKSDEFDLYYMSRCKGVVCANSTYSWWAGWLNQTNDKIITIPNKWINGKNEILEMSGAIVIKV